MLKVYRIYDSAGDTVRLCLPIFLSLELARARPAHPPRRERTMALLQDPEPLDVLSERRAALVAEIHCFLCAEYFLLAASNASTASTYFSRSSWLSLPVLDTSNFSNLIRKGRNMFHSSGCPHSSTPRTAAQPQYQRNGGGRRGSRRAGPRGGEALRGFRVAHASSCPR